MPRKMTFISNRNNIHILLRIISVFFLIALFSGNIKSQESGKGCTDPAAKNYDITASVNNGSCTYKTTVYNPPFKYLLPEEVQETSGLIYFDKAIWTINDGGNDPILYKLDRETGTVTARITFTNAGNTDWEALAQDEEYVYIGDFGNNRGTRNDLHVLKISKKDITGSGDSNVSSEFIFFSYPDYTGTVDKKKNNNFDCESMICIGDSLYLFSKNRGDNKTKLYRLPKQEGNYKADLIDSFDVRGLITGADYNKTTKEVTLLGYTNKTWLPFLWLLYDYEDNDLFSGNKRRIDMLNIPATQTEGIAYVDGRNCIITSEGRKLFTQTAYDLNTGKWIEDRKHEADTGELLLPEITATPNPMTGKRLIVHMKDLSKGTYIIKLISEDGSLVTTKKLRVKEEHQSLQTKLKTHKLKPGNYQLQVHTGTRVINLKCTKLDD